MNFILFVLILNFSKTLNYGNFGDFWQYFVKFFHILSLFFSIFLTILNGHISQKMCYIILDPNRDICKFPKHNHFTNLSIGKKINIVISKKNYEREERIGEVEI